MNYRRDMTVTVDGCDYGVELHPSGDVAWVYDAEGNKVADAEMDHAVECCMFSYFDDDGMLDGSSSSDLFRQWSEFGDLVRAWTPVVQWLVSTHPCN